jgi:AcrR family transcriptional regulator
MSTGRPGSKAKTAAERVRQPTEIRRRLIVEAARGVIAERGLFATTMRDIAQAGTVSLGTLTYHFTGLAEILGEVLKAEMDAFYTPIADRARDAADGAAAMQALIDGFFANDERTRQHWRLWLDFWGLSAHDPGYAQWQGHTYTRWRADVEAVLERGCTEGHFEIPDHELAIVDFMAIFDGLASQAFLPGSTIGPVQAREHLTGWVARAWGSPLPRPSIRRKK